MVFIGIKETLPLWAHVCKPCNNLKAVLRRLRLCLKRQGLSLFRPLNSVRQLASQNNITQGALNDYALSQPTQCCWVGMSSQEPERRLVYLCQTRLSSNMTARDVVSVRFSLFRRKVCERRLFLPERNMRPRLRTHPHIRPTPRRFLLWIFPVRALHIYIVHCVIFAYTFKPCY